MVCQRSTNVVSSVCLCVCIEQYKTLNVFFFSPSTAFSSSLTPAATKHCRQHHNNHRHPFSYLIHLAAFCNLFSAFSSPSSLSFFLTKIKDCSISTISNIYNHKNLNNSVSQRLDSAWDKSVTKSKVEKMKCFFFNLFPNKKKVPQLHNILKMHCSEANSAVFFVVEPIFSLFFLFKHSF